MFYNYKLLWHLKETFKLITYEEHRLWIETEFLRKSKTKVNNDTVRIPLKECDD